MTSVYASKIDAWLVAVLLVVMAACGFALVQALAVSSPAAWLTAAFIAGTGIGLPLWLLRTTRYTLDGAQLGIRPGPFKWTIPLADITAIAATSNPAASPALALDRLRITYGVGRSVMISPRNKAQFMRDIETARGSAV